MSTTVDLGKITASVDVGTTTTGAAGTNASVTNVGTTQDAVLNFTIPRGAQGVQGPQGVQGNTGPAGPTGPQGPMGDVAVITPEQQAAFTMYSVPGQNTDGPMTQKAVTDNYPLIDNLNEADFSISDPHGSEIVELKDGHIRTKYFDSRDVKTKVGDDDSSADMVISDENDNDIVEFKGGHIRTKYFNSKDLVVDKTYSYKGEKISLGDNYLTVQEMMSTTHTIPRYLQGCAVYGKYLFVADDYLNGIGVYDLEDKVLVNAVSFTPNPNYHCNNVNFGTYKYADTDATPCMYISQEKEDTHLILVFQVTFSNDVFGFNLVQTITMPAPQAGVSPYYPNSMIDADNGVLYVMGYSTNSYTESDSNKIIVLKYELPLPTDGDVTLQATDIYAKFPSITATQGGCIYKGKFYQAFGGDSTGSVVIRSSDMQNFCNRLYLADYGVTTEPEAACIYDDSLLVIGINKKVYKFKF